MKEQALHHLKHKGWRIVGIIGTVVCLIIYARAPSWPTPDKIIVFLTFVFMIFNQAKEMLKRLLPFVVLLLVYESFRGLVPHINHRVNYLWMPWADRVMFGGTLPTTTLQNWLWHGSAQWYDFMFYGFYMLHFILPISLAILIWKTRVQYYWQFIATYLSVSFAGFLTFLAFPAAPPWLAAEKGLIEPITRVSTNIFFSLGVQDFPSVYNKISPNPVAAVPSLHAAYATLLVIFVYKLYGWKWTLLAAVYPFMIYLGTTYMGEHYFVDELIGALYAVVGYFAVAWIFKHFKAKSAAKS